MKKNCVSVHFFFLHKTTFLCRNVMGTENGYVLYITLESLELKTAFLSNATKNKHDKECGTSFDVAILIKTHRHIF